LEPLFQELLPLMIVIALSPPGVIPAVLMLFTSDARRNAAGFLAGWAAGIAAATIVLAVLVELIYRPEERAAWAFWVGIAIGLLLIGLGVWKWMTRAEASETPGWMKAIDHVTPAGAVRLGLLLSALNPKVLVLAAAAGVVIGSRGPGPIGLLIAVVGFAAACSVVVAAPLVAHLIVGDAMMRPLATLRAWLEKNSNTITAVVLVVLGVLVLWKALAGG
jgi:threonine/homoserine/homoserine lactone efflux protein